MVQASPRRTNPLEGMGPAEQLRALDLLQAWLTNDDAAFLARMPTHLDAAEMTIGALAAVFELLLTKTEQMIDGDISDSEHVQLMSILRWSLMGA